jgi:hypothetical protein
MYKYLLLITGGFLLLCSYFYLKEALGKYMTFEGFEDKKSWEEQTKTLYKTMADKLCPPLITVITELAKDDDNQPLDKYINKKAKGSIMFCPAFEDMTALPADIGEQLVRTTRYLNDEIGYVMRKLRKSLEKTCEEQKNRGEGFEDINPMGVISTLSKNEKKVTISEKPDNEAIKAATAESEAAFNKAVKDSEPPPAPPSKPVGPPDPLREQICIQRFVSMYAAISSAPDVYGTLANIDSQYKQLKYFLQNPNAVKTLC